MKLNSFRVRILLYQALGQFWLDRNIQLGTHHHGVRHSFGPWVVIEEYVGTLDRFVVENGFQADGVWPQLFRRVQVIVSFVAVLVPPPFLELSSVQPEIQQWSRNTFEILPD